MTLCNLFKEGNLTRLRVSWSNGIKCLWTGLALVLFVMSYAEPSAREEAIVQRIKPVGTVNVKGQTAPPSRTDKTALSKKPVLSDAERAEQIYETNCITCHDAGTAGAPKLGDTKAWAERKKKGIKTLINNSITGFNQFMPARGTCMECSDEDMALVVNYMVNYKDKE